MEKKTKIGLISLGILLASMFAFTGVDMWGRDYSEPYAEIRNVKQLTLKEQPAQVTKDDLEARSATRIASDKHNVTIYGEFVPFSIHGKKDAYRAVMACADLIGADESADLRYSDWAVGFLGIWGFLSGVDMYPFYQYYNGFPVLNSAVLVETARFGKPESITAYLYSGFPDDLPTEPKITAEDAIRAAALHEMNEPDQHQTPFLVIAFDNNDRAALAWLVVIGYEPVCVNAVTGEVLDIDSYNNYEYE